VVIKAVKFIFAWIIECLTTLYWFIKTIGENPLEYKLSKIKRTPEEWQKEWDELQGEIQQFLKQVEKRFPHQWSFGEIAWYESIRRREATL